jgi:hypothetical protein
LYKREGGKEGREEGWRKERRKEGGKGGKGKKEGREEGSKRRKGREGKGKKEKGGRGGGREGGRETEEPRCGKRQGAEVCFQKRFNYQLGDPCHQLQQRATGSHGGRAVHALNAPGSWERKSPLLPLTPPSVFMVSFINMVSGFSEP